MPLGLYPVTEVDGEIVSGVQRLDLPWGYVLFGYPGKNEFTVVNLVIGDPPGMRYVDAWGNCGKWSFCYGASPRTAVELFLFQGKKDERTRGREDLAYGEATMHVRGPRRWEGENADGKRDDQMYPIALFLHDYVWVKGINGEVPQKPWLELPPPSEPPPPSEDPDLDAWLAQTERHIDELDAIAREFAAVGGPEFVPDLKTREAYLSGRNRDLKSIHDDMVDRNGFDPGPCQWKE